MSLAGIAARFFSCCCTPDTKYVNNTPKEIFLVLNQTGDPEALRELKIRSDHCIDSCAYLGNIYFKGLRASGGNSVAQDYSLSVEYFGLGITQDSTRCSFYLLTQLPYLAKKCTADLAEQAALVLSSALKSHTADEADRKAFNKCLGEFEDRKLSFPYLTESPSDRHSRESSEATQQLLIRNGF